MGLLVFAAFAAVQGARIHRSATRLHSGVNSTVFNEQIQAKTDVLNGLYTLTDIFDERCLIFGHNGGATHPSRYSWGHSRDFCGVAGGEQSLIGYRQALWTIESLPSNPGLYTIKSDFDGRCLIFGESGRARNPTRYNWGYDNHLCGFRDEQSLVNNKQGVWFIEALPSSHNLYTIKSWLDGRCLIFGGNGHQEYPERYGWGHGNRFCGFPGGERALIDNRQGVWQINRLGASMAQGQWNLVQSSSGGEVNFEYTVSVTNEEGEVVTIVDDTEITRTINSGFSFWGASLEVSLSTTARQSVSRTTSSTISRTSSQTHRQICPRDPERGNSVQLYRWIVTASGKTVNSDQFRCHYSPGSLRRPECPFGFCGDYNELCREENCEPWSA